MHPSRLCLVVVLAAALAGCASDPPTVTQPSVAPSASNALTALPACPSPPPSDEQEVEGLVLPAGSVVNSVTEQKPLVTVIAFVPLTPIEFEAAYPEMDGIEVLVTENEIYEAELLVSNGTHRNFLKATATCSTGSNLVAVVAPEVDAEGLPLPQGAATPRPTP